MRLSPASQPSAALHSEVRSMLGLAWPIIGAQLLTLSMVTVDNVMVARLGETPLAALALGASVFSVFNVAAIGLLSALTPLISEAESAGRPRDIGIFVRHGLLVSLVASGVMISICFGAAPFLRLFARDPSLVPQAHAYLLAIAWGLPAHLIFLCLRRFTEDTSDTRPSVVIAGLAAGLNIVLDYALIYGHFGLPRLGLVGAGYATSLIMATMAVTLALYIRFHGRYRRYAVGRRIRRPDGKVINTILRLGLPLSASVISEVAFFGGTTLVMSTLGTRPLAAHQIALNAAAISFMVPLGLSFAASIRVGSAMGAESPVRVRAAAAAAVVIAVVFELATAVLFLAAPHVIARLYTDDPNLIALAVQLLRLAGIFQLFDGLQVIGMGLLRGIRDTKIPFYNTLGSFWLIGFPVGLACTFGLGVGPQGLWWGLLAGLFAAAVAHHLRFWSKVGPVEAPAVEALARKAR